MNINRISLSQNYYTSKLWYNKKKNDFTVPFVWKAISHKLGYYLFFYEEWRRKWKRYRIRLNPHFGKDVKVAWPYIPHLISRPRRGGRELSNERTISLLIRDSLLSHSLILEIVSLIRRCSHSWVVTIWKWQLCIV